MQSVGGNVMHHYGRDEYFVKYWKLFQKVGAKQFAAQRAILKAEMAVGKCQIKRQLSYCFCQSVF